MHLNNNKRRYKMIEDKNTLIENAEWKLEYAKKIVKENSALFEECRKYHDIWIAGKEGRDAYLYISDIFITTNVATTNDGTNNWTGITLYSITPTSSGATSIMGALSTASDTANVLTDRDGDITYPDRTPSNYGGLSFIATKNNSPGDLTLYLCVEYRMIIT